MTASRWSARAVFYGTLLVLWEVVSRVGPWPPYLFPGPLEVLRALVAGIQGGSSCTARW